MHNSAHVSPTLLSLAPGHFHVYSRTCPVHNRTCIPAAKPDGRLGGPVHVTTGWGGPQSFSSLAAQPYIVATNNATFSNGFLRVNVSRTSLDVDALAVGMVPGFFGESLAAVAPPGLLAAAWRAWRAFCSKQVQSLIRLFCTFNNHSTHRFVARPCADRLQRECAGSD